MRSASDGCAAPPAESPAVASIGLLLAAADGGTPDFAPPCFWVADHTLNPVRREAVKREEPRGVAHKAMVFARYENSLSSPRAAGSPRFYLRGLRPPVRPGVRH